MSFTEFAFENVNKVSDILFELMNHTSVDDQWPLLLTWFNFNPNMDK